MCSVHSTADATSLLSASRSTHSRLLLSSRLGPNAATLSSASSESILMSPPFGNSRASV